MITVDGAYHIVYLKSFFSVALLSQVSNCLTSIAYNSQDLDPLGVASSHEGS